VFRDARKLDRQRTDAGFRLAMRRYQDGAESWFDGSVGSIDARLAACNRLLHHASATVARLDLTAAVPYLHTADSLHADRRVLTALRDDLLTGASGREDVIGPPGWRTAESRPEPCICGYHPKTRKDMQEHVDAMVQHSWSQHYTPRKGRGRVGGPDPTGQHALGPGGAGGPTGAVDINSGTGAPVAMPGTSGIGGAGLGLGQGAGGSSSMRPGDVAPTGGAGGTRSSSLNELRAQIVASLHYAADPSQQPPQQPQQQNKEWTGNAGFMGGGGSFDQPGGPSPQPQPQQPGPGGAQGIGQAIGKGVGNVLGIGQPGKTDQGYAPTLKGVGTGIADEAKAIGGGAAGVATDVGKGAEAAGKAAISSPFNPVNAGAAVAQGELGAAKGFAQGVTNPQGNPPPGAPPPAQPGAPAGAAAGAAAGQAPPPPGAPPGGSPHDAITPPGQPNDPTGASAHNDGSQITDDKYTVQHGDTLANIAQRSGWGSNWQGLAQAAGIKNPNALNAGQEINLGGQGRDLSTAGGTATPPAGGPPPAQGRTDALSNYMKQQGFSQDEIAKTTGALAPAAPAAAPPKSAGLSGPDRRWVTLEAARFVAANADATDDSYELATRAHHHAQVKTSTFHPAHSAAVCRAFVAQVCDLGDAYQRRYPVQRTAATRIPVETIDPQAMFL